jgi:dienelactone hydrolase/antitoxin (DNA-binding transcriptional repressor) of toxin-antitoxin stability system
MRQVKIAELKARLSYYVRAAERGDRIEILDRNRAIAQLGPLDEGDDDLELKLPLIPFDVGRDKRVAPAAWADKAEQLLITDRDAGGWGRARFSRAQLSGLKDASSRRRTETAMVRRLGLLLVIVLAVPSLTAAPGARAGLRTIDGDPSDWTGETTRLGGTSQVSHGEFIYQDYVYDDYGADTRQRAPQHGTTRDAATAGDFRYPTDEARYGNNAADILQLRLAADAENIDILLVLDTLKAPDTTVLALAVDEDRDTATGGGPWPFDAGLSTPGTDAVVTVWGTGGAVTRMSDGTATPLADVAADTTHNAIEARVPRSLVHGAAWRVHAATGLWDGHSWMAIPPTAPTETAPGYGSPSVAARAFNVAFRDGESGPYFEALQSAALATGDISAFAADIDLGAADSTYAQRTGRLYEAVLHESFTIPPAGEGHGWEGVHGRGMGIAGAALEQTFAFYGPDQPYAVYVPRDYDPAHPLPMALVLHGHGGAHCGWQCTPNFREQVGELPGDPMLLVSPLARGSSMYADYGEQDVLEVLADATSRYAVDPERVYVAGYSMGGYGTLRFASLYPDRFAAAVSIAGYTGEFTGRYNYDQRHLGYPRELYDAYAQNVQPLTPLNNERDRQINGDHVESADGLLHVPLLQLGGTDDEILPVTGQYAAAARLDDLGYRHRFDLYPGYEHLSFGIVDDWHALREWFGDTRRVASPRRVVYRFSDASIDPAVPMPLVHGRAYWLLAAALRDGDHSKPSLNGRIDATSHALPDTAHTARRTQDVSVSPTPNIRTGIAWIDGPPEPLTNALDMSLQNLVSARLSAAGAGLDPTTHLEIRIVTDGPAQLVVDGRFGESTAAVREGVATATVTSSGVTVDVPAAGAISVAIDPV